MSILKTKFSASKPALLGVIAVASLGFCPSVSVGQEFPTKPVRLIVPFPPGGTPDVIARLLSDKLSPMWKQPVIVEHKPGASSNIGSDFVAKAPPDGHTLLMVPNNIPAINPLVFSRMPFNPEKDLASVTLVGITPFLLVTGPSLPADSVQAVVETARGRPNGITYASSGVGSNQHLFAEMLRSLTGAPMTHVPYKGGPASIVDVVGGVVDMQFGAVPSVLPHIRSGRLKALAVTGSKRVKALPQVPTLVEAGIAGFENEGWIGLSAPAGVPAGVLERINRDVREVLKRQDVIDALLEHGIEASTGTPAEMAARIAAEKASWSKVVAEAGIRAE
ncbi:MAG: tripartite tricarboxylate transporter substrate binding protein [Pigmentiphaga sp.]|uniref:Bug family tripartite tricarboxylate transporter substrate binding protein n=1 Tax=Pigmentiphaga sp. TaxID=1977564 RepID=UPI0029A684AF|nr:tripartite tricarboxylate transporter substrate binding protein [Pigmentiphaga sp.]MDX3905960.1 tripartite tricarboxylate transporter substrate binding protein [Pigmentiphaga sp.]